MAQKLIDVVAGYRFIWEEKPFIVAVSIGIVPISELTINSNDLLRNADIACYAAKNAGEIVFASMKKMFRLLPRFMLIWHG
jgi:GGDEF domain-containing protein